jgi:hypothetical protein
MGVYDFFRGKCPHCSKRFDCDDSGCKCGDIQTKMFTRPSFRSFFPGDVVPDFYCETICIGNCNHCQCHIIAIFIRDRVNTYLIGYK